MSRREQALAYFVSMGWSLPQAAGIVANLESESGLRPDAVGDSGLAFGLAQWHPDRQSNFAAVIGHDIHASTFEEQLAFVHAELNNWERAAGDALRATTTAAEAGAVVSMRYERPKDREGEAAKRGALAEQIAATAPATQPRETPMAGLGDTLAQAAPIVGTALGGPLGGLIGGLAGALLSGFQPLAQQKVQQAVAKHTDPATAQKVTDLLNQGLVEAAQRFTGQADPIQATATALKDPAVMKAIQDQTLADLDKIGSFLTMLADLQERAMMRAEESMDHATQRQLSSPENRKLAYAMGQATAVGMILVVGVLLAMCSVQLYAKGIIDGTVATLAGGALAVVYQNAGQVFNYLFGQPADTSITRVGVQELQKRSG